MNGELMRRGGDAPKRQEVAVKEKRCLEANLSTTAAAIGSVVPSRNHHDGHASPPSSPSPNRCNTLPRTSLSPRLSTKLSLGRRIWQREREMGESEERCGGEEEGECCSKSSKGDRTRRFSEEQIRSLESTFEAQTKLEARQKQQLARELGLQPRQVGIWFQNKRARWKSKQLDREYRALRADYDALLSRFDSLNKEKQLLLKQRQGLTELLDKTEKNDRDAASKEKEWPRPSLKEEPDLEFAGCTEEEEEDDNTLSYFCEDEPGPRAVQPATSSLPSSAEKQLHSATGRAAAQRSCSNSPWWEFWPLSE